MTTRSRFVVGHIRPKGDAPSTPAKAPPDGWCTEAEAAEWARDLGLCPMCMVERTGGEVCGDCERYEQARARGWED